MPPAAFRWTDRYLLGYAPMDDSHRGFVDIVGALLDAPDPDIAARLEAFVRHVLGKTRSA